MQTTIRTLLLAGALTLAPAAAHAKKDKDPAPFVPPPVVLACAISDLQAATACSGYFGGNLNGGSGDKVAEQQYALSLLDFTWDGETIVEKIENIDSIAFSLPLTGINYISIHYGNGNGPAKDKGGTTGFYKVETSEELTQLSTVYGSLSNAILYASFPSTPGGGDGEEPGDGGGIGATVPEPAVWAQLILGFGLIGLARRRRPASVAA